MPNNWEGQILLYQTEDERVSVNVRFGDETFWMTQKAISELFGTTAANINIYIKNVLDDDELTAASTIKDFIMVQTESSREVKLKVQSYNLDVLDRVTALISQRKQQLEQLDLLVKSQVGAKCQCRLAVAA